jgi:hypothetical protein
MKSTITPLAIHIMRMFSLSSSSWLVIDRSFFGCAPRTVPEFVWFSTERDHYPRLILQPAYASNARAQFSLPWMISWRCPILPVMRLYLVAYQSHQAEFLGAAVVEAFDQIKARERAEAAGIHQPGAMSIVTQVDAVPPDLIGRKLSPRDVKKLVTGGPKKPPAPSVRV